MNTQITLGNLSPEARAEMARIGPIWGRDIHTHGDIVFNTYMPLLRAVPYRGFRAVRDISMVRMIHAFGDDTGEARLVGRRQIGLTPGFCIGGVQLNRHRLELPITGRDRESRPGSRVTHR